jgi:hypothetical protein
VSTVLTISRLKRWSIRYYNDTANTAGQSAMDRQAAIGGLGEYYSEADTRIPTWLIAGDQAAVAGLSGLDAAAVAGGAADTAVAGAWLDDGIAPNGQVGRAFTEASVHGFDLTFAAPKSLSLLRLPGLVGSRISTRRRGDPHLHTRVIVPNRQPRADGVLVSLDSKSLYHEAKAAWDDLPGHPAT